MTWFQFVTKQPSIPVLTGSVLSGGDEMTDQTTTPTVSDAAVAIDDLARMLEAVRYTTGLGAKQMGRIAKAKATAAALRAMPEVQASEKVRLIETKIYLLGDDHGLCVGGRFDGWKCWRHPDGEWVTVKKLDCVQPTFGLAPPPQEVK